MTAADNAPSTLPTPSCPASTGSFWPVDPSAALPTIAGLDFANIKPASASAAATSTGTGTGTGTNSSSPNHTTSKSGLSTGAKAGIGVGVACSVILALSVLFWFLYRRRLHNNQPADANQEASSAPTSAGPVPELPATKIWRHLPSELPAEGEGGQAQELDSVAIHEAGYGADKPEGEGVSREKTVYK